MLWWWLAEAASNPGYYGEGNHPWDPFALGTYNVGTPVLWCAAVLLVFLLFTNLLGRWSLRGGEDEEEP
jgi:hypothetical protein